MAMKAPRRTGLPGTLKPVRLTEVDESGGHAPPPADVRHPMRRLFRYIRPHRASFWLGCFWSLSNMVADLMPPILTKWVLDSVEGSPPGFVGWVVDPENKQELAAFWAGLTFVVFAVESLTEYLYKRTFMGLAQNMEHDLRCELWGAVAAREQAFFEAHTHGDTLSVMSEDVSTLERFLNTGFNELLVTLGTVAFSFAVMMAVNQELAAVSVTPMPLILFGSFWFHRRIAPRYTRVREASGGLLARLENNVSGVAVTKAFNAQAAEAERVRGASAEYRAANLHAIELSALYVPVIRMVVALGYAGVLYLGTVYAIEGRLSAGDLALYSMLSQRVLWPITRLGQTLDEAERASASARRAFRLLDTPSAIRDPAPAERERLPPPASNGSGREIRFDGVAFGYGHGREPVFRGLDLTVAPGTFLGVAGATGAGKTSLTKLLLRSYDPSGGAVRLDGVDIRRLTLDELRAQVSLVSQDGYVFSGTLRENIAYGSSAGATLDEVRRAARAAHFDEFVMGLPERYETMVGERGVRLSGGQRQRLAMARALLKQAPVLVLDEATASVDSKTERIIQANLGRLIRGRTAVVIAHRLSTVRHADRIVVLHEGRVVEDGTHDELVELRGRYWQLWSTQIGEVPKDADRDSDLDVDEPVLV